MSLSSVYSLFELVFYKYEITRIQSSEIKFHAMGISVSVICRKMSKSVLLFLVGGV